MKLKREKRVTFYKNKPANRLDQQLLRKNNANTNKHAENSKQTRTPFGNHGNSLSWDNRAKVQGMRAHNRVQR